MTAAKALLIACPPAVFVGRHFQADPPPHIDPASLHREQDRRLAGFASKTLIRPSQAWPHERPAESPSPPPSFHQPHYLLKPHRNRG